MGGARRQALSVLINTDIFKVSMESTKFITVRSLLTTLIVTLTLTLINLGWGEGFVFVWLRSWLIAFLIMQLASLWLVPIIKKYVS